MIGLARTLVLNPFTAQHWLDRCSNEIRFPRFPSPPPGAITAWYTMRLTALAKDQEQQFDLSLESALQQYLERDRLRADRWRQRLST
ncbi:hypothetical protein [Motiliproteus sp.]|uniref:hypothetical protein n=1 Tax=Motiliproteus sp. TaxID=1898955 RepID=UPI003BA9A201